MQTVVSGKAFDIRIDELIWLNTGLITSSKQINCVFKMLSLQGGAAAWILLSLLPDVGVSGAPGRPLMVAMCCIWAAAKAAMGLR